MSKRRRRLRRHHLRKYAANIIGGTNGIDKHYFREMYERNLTSDKFKDRLPRIHKAMDSPLHGHICLHDGVIRKLFMFWNSEYTRFYFIKQERDNVAWTSISYSTRERAMRAFHNNKIIFKNA